jgi:hypothetical protein
MRGRNGPEMGPPALLRGWIPKKKRARCNCADSDNLLEPSHFREVEVPDLHGWHHHIE